jgi:hypothetical protein
VRARLLIVLLLSVPGEGGASAQVLTYDTVAVVPSGSSNLLSSGWLFSSALNEDLVAFNAEERLAHRVSVDGTASSVEFRAFPRPVTAIADGPHGFFIVSGTAVYRLDPDTVRKVATLPESFRTFGLLPLSHDSFVINGHSTEAHLVGLPLHIIKGGQVQRSLSDGDPYFRASDPYSVLRPLRKNNDRVWVIHPRRGTVSIMGHDDTELALASTVPITNGLLIDAVAEHRGLLALLAADDTGPIELSLVLVVNQAVVARSRPDRFVGLGTHGTAYKICGNGSSFCVVRVR